MQVTSPHIAEIVAFYHSSWDLWIFLYGTTAAFKIVRRVFGSV